MAMRVARQPFDDCMNRRKPNLFLIGAMKSGTTYLRKLLNAHPAIFMCDPDEPSYFVEPRQLRAIWPEMWTRDLWRSEENYLRLFSLAGEATILGEASTNYTKLPNLTGVAERIEAFNPEARFIYLLRDPIERTFSHYWHMVRYHAEHRPIAEAIRRDSEFLAVSYYAMQLQPFLERFGRDRIAILTHESLVRHPVDVMRSLYGWLGVGTEGVDMLGFAQPEHVTPNVIRASIWGGVPRRLWQWPVFRHVRQHVPRSIESVLRGLATRDRCRRLVDTTSVAELLRPIQLLQTEELIRLIGRGFPEWTTLNKHQGSLTGMQTIARQNSVGHSV
jgi:Sulfotransferase family